MKQLRNGARSWIGSVGQLGRRPALRWILPAQLVSALGDGMSMVAVAWLAVQIAPDGQAGVWTGLAVAAYALPAPVGAALLAPLMRRLRAAQLVAADASVRAVTLGTVAVLAVTGLLEPAVFVALLAVSSLLHAWGSAGVYTLVAELLPEDDQVTGNALLSTFAQSAFVAGPALAGGLTALTGPGWVIGVDAASFAVLAAAAWALAARQTATATTAADSPDAPASSGWRAILDRPRLLGLLAVTCVFFFLYGPVEVALPVHVAHGLHGSPGLLGLYWTAFGIGATLGSLGAVLLRHLPPWQVVVAVIVGWGAALLPLGLTDAVVPGLVGFAAGGLIYGPFTAISTALFQRGTPPQVLSRVLAARSALTTPATGLGTLLGGPVVTAIGGRNTLLISALLTIALGLSVAAALRFGRRGAGTAAAPAPARTVSQGGPLVAVGAQQS
ncbi:MFS transporter [Catellatospora coxensis]|uniref:Putative multidrug-efflux transporter n=1 Tax=Catellatospora coxensis TaxID=310354 RepID=A0A8J3L0E8_9ACTN|nr:MFS transporter [Catellatospora coxensis]GIG09508.1 putative multidrug-efflux transporter [Catellatospora coxensis]